jgi:hypothetical protein
MQAPVRMQQFTDLTRWDSAGATVTPELAAGAIVRQYIPDIAQFIQSMRQQYSLGSVEITSQHRTWPGLRVVYQNQSGVERIAVIVQPTTAGQPTGGASIIAVDIGSFAHYDFGQDNTVGYPGGFNVYRSIDGGKTWTVVATLGGFGATTAPESFGSLTYFLQWETTFSFEQGGQFSVFPPVYIGQTLTFPIIINGVTFADAVTAATFPYDSGTGITGLGTTPYAGGVPANPDNKDLLGFIWIVDYGDSSGGETAALNGFNGFSNYVVCGDATTAQAKAVRGLGGQVVFVISGYYFDAGNTEIAIFYRSTDGKTWTPINLPGAPINNDTTIWFDDGTQRTHSPNANSPPDGPPTFLWFCEGDSGVVYSSPDATDGSWTAQLTLSTGTNGLGKTDSTDVGPEDIYLAPSQLPFAPVYGNGRGVQIIWTTSPPTLNGGTLGTDPSTWGAITLPGESVITEGPPGASSGPGADLKEALMNGNRAAYFQGGDNDQLQYEWDSTNLDPAAFAAAYPNGPPTLQPPVPPPYSPSAPQPGTPFSTVIPISVTFSDANGFVAVGAIGDSEVTYTNLTNGEGAGHGVPAIWTSKDGVTWALAQTFPTWNTNYPMFSVAAVSAFAGQAPYTVPNP